MIGAHLKDFHTKIERSFTVLYNPNSDNIIIMSKEHELIQGETFNIPFNEMVKIMDDIRKTWKESK